MANAKISALPSASALTGTEVLPIVQSSVTVKTTAQDIADLAASAPEIKAWVRFDATTVAGGFASITSSYNVTSVTYEELGVYTVNFTNALSDANYLVVGGNLSAQTQTRGGVFIGPYMTDFVGTGISLTTTSAKINARMGANSSANAANYDPNPVTVLFVEA